jgi:hypothetical protein
VLAFPKVDLGTVPEWLALLAIVGAFTSYWGRRRSAALQVYAVVTEFSRSTPPSDDDHTDYKIVNNGTQLIRNVSISAWESGRRRWFWRFRKLNRWMTGERLEGRVHFAVEPGNPASGDDMTSASWAALMEAPYLMLIFEQGRRRWVQWPDARMNRLYTPTRWRLGVVRRFWGRVGNAVKGWANPPGDRQ